MTVEATADPDPRTAPGPTTAPDPTAAPAPRAAAEVDAAAEGESPAEVEQPHRPSLSPSRAADFKTCPLLYRFRSIDRLPERPGPDQVRDGRGQLRVAHPDHRAPQDGDDGGQDNPGDGQR